jgi:predicted ATPase
MAEVIRAPLHPQPAATRPPASATPLVGRSAEETAICRQLREAGVRLLTLTGPAGVGKTRLAAHVAGLLAADFASVSWIDLTAVAEAGAVFPYLARKLTARDAAGESALDLIAAALQSQRCLLVLDNFEHVAAAAPGIGKLLAASPDLTILVTSRAALRLPWEQLFPVAPLRLPQATDAPGAVGPAVTLFLQRVQAVQPAFQ